eukprot:41273_1
MAALKCSMLIILILFIITSAKKHQYHQKQIVNFIQKPQHYAYTQDRKYEYNKKHIIKPSNNNHHSKLIDRLQDVSEDNNRRRLRGRRRRRRRRRRRHRGPRGCHYYDCRLQRKHYQQPRMYAVQNYGFQMAGNPGMPYGVAYAYPVSYHSMKVPVVHGAMMHPATGMIHPYTAMPHPALFGPKKKKAIKKKRNGMERLIPLGPV